jgi:hypothetical protein
MKMLTYEQVSAARVDFHAFGIRGPVGCPVPTSKRVRAPFFVTREGNCLDVWSVGVARHVSSQCIGVNRFGAFPLPLGPVDSIGE